MNFPSLGGAVLALFLGTVAQAADLPILKSDDVAVSFENGLYTGRFSFQVPVAQAVAWAVLTDFAHMTSFIPNLESSQVLSQDGEVQVIAQRGRVSYGPFSFAFESERRIETHPQSGRILSRAISGSAKHMASEMRVLQEGPGTRLDYKVELIPGRWYPSSFGISGMRHEMAEQFTAMAAEMVRRAEARPKP